MKDKKEIFKLIGIILGGLAILIGCIFGIVKLSNLSNSKQQDSNIVVSDVEENGIRLRKDKYAVEPNYDSCTITAEVGPSYASNTQLEWSLEWGDKQKVIRFDEGNVNYKLFDENKYYAKSKDCILNTFNQDNTQFSQGYLLFFLPKDSSITVISHPGYANYQIKDEKSIVSNIYKIDEFTYKNESNVGKYIRLYSLDSNVYLKRIILDYTDYCNSVNLSDFITLNVTDETKRCNIEVNTRFQCPINLVCTSESNPNVSSKVKMDYVGRDLAPLFDLDLSNYSISTLTSYDIYNEISKHSNDDYVCIGGTLMWTPDNLYELDEYSFPILNNDSTLSESCSEMLPSNTKVIDLLNGAVDCCYTSLEEAIETLLTYNFINVDISFNVYVETYYDDETGQSISEKLFETYDYVNFIVIWGDMDYTTPTSISLSDNEIIF